MKAVNFTASLGIIMALLNIIIMYSTLSVVAERFIRTVKDKIYKYMIGISKNVYFIVLNDIANEYNNTLPKNH